MKSNSNKNSKFVTKNRKNRLKNDKNDKYLKKYCKISNNCIDKQLIKHYNMYIIINMLN